jgi:hypothetical protein
MEHPLIGDLDQLTVDELSAKVTDLNRKLAIAARGGNAYLCNQLRMAIESYQNKYQQRVQETYRQQIKDANFDDKIKIE